MKSNTYTIAYAAVLALVCSIALTAVNELTKDDYADNLAAKKARNIMTVLGISFDENASSKEIVEIGKQKITEDKARAERYGVKMIYSSDHPEHGQLWAIEFEGEGMWKPIEALLCLKADMKTIYGVSFYKQEETPGLGAKIAEAKFQNGFKGKTIYSASGEAKIVIKSGAAGPNEIDAVSAATVTSLKVQDMLNKLITKLANAKASEVSDGR